MLNHESSLPEPWIERIWVAMRANYGAVFDRQWQCPAGIDPVEHVSQLKAHWGHGLARFQQNPDAIRYGLENLPEYPPSLVQFRALCNRRPDQPVQQLPAPNASQEAVGATVARLAKCLNEHQPANPRDWIPRLQARAAAGERLGMAQRECLAVALRADISSALDEVSADEQRRREDERRDQAERVAQYAAARWIELQPTQPAAAQETQPC